MKRTSIWCLPLALFAWCMASERASANDLPVPPIPPTAAPLMTAAPVPNSNLTNPIAAGDPRPTVAIRFYRNEHFDTGYGFAPGSRFQSAEDTKPFQTPGISVSVPIK